MEGLENFAWLAAILGRSMKKQTIVRLDLTESVNDKKTTTYWRWNHNKSSRIYKFQKGPLSRNFCSITGAVNSLVVLQILSSEIQVGLLLPSRY